MKAVLISIQPKWCELIASVKKTIEIRKTKPKLETPFKVYIYCTKAKKFFTHGGIRESLEDLYRLPSGEIKYGYSGEMMCYDEYEYNENNFLNGKVIGEFVCDAIIRNCEMANADIAEQQGCIKRGELFEYAGGKELYGWHISDLVIYDEPKELSEFYTYKGNEDCCGGCVHHECPIDTEPCMSCQGDRNYLYRPPQSWCYVEELG